MKASSWRVEGTCVSYNKGQGVFVSQDRSLCIFYLFKFVFVWVLGVGSHGWKSGQLVGLFFYSLGPQDWLGVKGLCLQSLCIEP